MKFHRNPAKITLRSWNSPGPWHRNCQRSLSVARNFASLALPGSRWSAANSCCAKRFATGPSDLQNATWFSDPPWKTWMSVHIIIPFLWLKVTTSHQSVLHVHICSQETLTPRRRGHLWTSGAGCTYKCLKAKPRSVCVGCQRWQNKSILISQSFQAGPKCRNHKFVVGSLL